jgi:multicomponent Na+:H+ antiporter subunit E
MTGRLRIPSLLVWLTLLWVALWGDVTAGNVLGGLLVAIVVVAVARPTGVTGLERTYFRPVAALHYGLYFVMQMVKSNLVVAWEIITPGTSLNRAIIAVPMHTSSAGVVALVANSITLTPGTVTVQVIEEPSEDGLVDRTLFIHVLHFLGVDAVHRDVLRLERLAIKAFGSANELPRLDAELAAMFIEKDVSS